MIIAPELLTLHLGISGVKFPEFFLNGRSRKPVRKGFSYARYTPFKQDFISSIQVIRHIM